MVDRVTLPVATAVAKVIHPGTLKYAFGFETGGVDSWTATGSWGAVSNRVAHHGTWVGERLSSAAVPHLTRAIAGLTIGRVYTFSAWLARVSAGTAVGESWQIGVSGIGAAAAVTPALAVWTQLTYQFTATATSHTFQLTGNVTSGGAVADWDDIRLVENEYQVGSDIPLNLKPASSITLDERHAPYAEAKLEIALPSQSDLDLLDTRTTNYVRVAITTGVTFVAPALPVQARVFDLLLHEREADHEPSAEKVTLICRSDEALFIDAGNVTTTTDASAVDDQKSLRSLIATKLESRFAILSPGTADADFTITTELTNRCTTPSFETVVTGAAVSTGASAFASVTSGPTPSQGTHSLRWTAAAGTSAIEAVLSSSAVTPGQTYSWSFDLGSQVSRSALARMVFYDAGAVALSTVDSAAAATPTSGMTRYTVTAVAPAGAVTVKVQIVVSANASGNLHYTDGWLFCDSSLTDYFDGATAPGTYYTYVWTGTANASSSRRVRLDSRDPNLLYQEPGTKDWDFMQQLVQVAGLRLFCDELRVWRLVNPATYVPAGTVALAGAKRGRDKISRESGDWCDAVVVKYTWIGTDGLQKVQYDSATAGGTCLLLVEWNRPYPGPGAAAAVLARYQGRGRVQELIAPFDLTPTPGMALTTTLPNTPNQAGYASRVVWDLGSFQTTVNARDLVNV